MDRVEAMGVFLAAVDEGSFSAAGRRLGMPVQTVSRKVAELEGHLRTTLLTRTTRKLTLTDPGLVFAAAARRIVEEVEHAEREAAGEYVAPRGDLVVTAPLFFGRLHVLPVVAEFLALYPEINVRLALRDRVVNLVDDGIDMAVRIGRLPDSGLIATRVGSTRTVICASPALLASRGTPDRPADLAHLPCISPDGDDAPSTAWRFLDPDRRAEFEVTVRPRLTVASEALREAAIRGVGFARFLHYQVADPLREGRLATVLDRYGPEPHPVHLIHAARGQMPLKLRRFTDFAVPRLRQVLAGIGGP